MMIDAGTRRALLWMAALGLLGAGLILAMARLPVLEWLGGALAGLRGGGAGALAAFAALHVLAIVAFVPVSPFVFAAGMVWGTAGGVAIITLDNLVGPLLAFWLARRWLRPAARRVMAGSRYARAIDRAMALGGFRAVILLRLSPIVPMSVLNCGLGLFALPARTYAAATALGLLPITVLYCWAGAGIGRLGALTSGELEAGPAEQGLFWVGLAATFGAVWYLERLAKHALAEVDRTDEGGSHP